MSDTCVLWTCIFWDPFGAMFHKNTWMIQTQNWKYDNVQNYKININKQKPELMYIVTNQLIKISFYHSNNYLYFINFGLPSFVICWADSIDIHYHIFCLLRNLRIVMLKMFKLSLEYVEKNLTIMELDCTILNPSIKGSWI